MNRLIILGASGHGRVIADIAQLNGYEDIVFLDDNPTSEIWSGYPLVGSCDGVTGLAGDLFVAMGNSDLRRKFMEANGSRYFPILVHPKATISTDVSLGRGTAVMAGAVINPAAKIGQGCIVNTGAIIEHDCYLGDYCHVAVSASLCGTVTVGAGTWLGAGCVVSNNVKICSKVVVGAGAVVVKDIKEEGTYVGVPARKMNFHNSGGGKPPN